MRWRTTLGLGLVGLLCGCNESTPRPLRDARPEATWVKPTRIETSDADCDRCEIKDGACQTWVRNPHDMDLTSYDVPCDPVCCDRRERGETPAGPDEPPEVFVKEVVADRDPPSVDTEQPGTPVLVPSPEPEPAPPPEPPNPEGLPKRPSANDYSLAIRPHRKKAQTECQPLGGVPDGEKIEIAMVFEGATGKVESAVANTFADTPAAECAVKLFEKVEVPRFLDEKAKITYKLRLSRL